MTIFYSTREKNAKYTEYLRKTSGIKDVEIIELVNQNQYSLTEAYNKGLKEAKNDIIVFLHDDLFFNTDKWGKKIINHFNNSDFGIIGLAGTTKLNESGKWWENPELMAGIVNHKHEGKTHESKYCQPHEDKILETLLLDGLFFAVDRKRIKTNFDEEVKGFHFYDISFTLENHLLGVKVGVVTDIRVTHLSIGQVNQEWEDNRVLFVEKHKSVLPIEIFPKIDYEDKEITLKTEPKLAIIIPTKGKLELLFNCIDSILEISKYSNYIVYIADTGSTDDEKTELKEYIKKSDKIRLIEYDYYNFAEINNNVIENHIDKDSELILFCNNDIKLINDAISRMVKVYIEKKNVGTVGCRLHFENGKIQHAGVIIWQDKEGRYLITHKGINSCYNYSENNIINQWGSTGGFLLIKKELFISMGKFTKTSECFEDVILNISTLANGYDNYFVGNAVCYHYESQTRNDSELKIKRTMDDYYNCVLPVLEKYRQKLFTRRSK